MTTPAQRDQTPLADTALAMIGRRFEVQLTELEEASKGWAARPHSPEARFIGTMIGTMRGFGQLALAIAGDAKVLVNALEQTVDTRLKVAETDLQRFQKGLEDSAALIDRAREALSNVDKEREHLAANIARSMAGDIVKALKPQLAAEVTIRNRNRNWQGFGLAALATLGVVMFGFVLGSWQISGPSVAESAIERCVRAPSLDSTGHAWCDLSSLPHLSLTPR